ncbi:MAG: hypothetical protein N4A50_14710 [Vallitalea sp.]|nr:hypothetical protein [Vallitalea sp.]
MKKLIYSILTIMLVMTGCSSDANEKSKEALRAEIRAEIEAEQKAKDDMKQVKDKKQEDKKVIDITDKKSVIDFIFQKFNVSDSYSKEKGIKELTFTYEDFNEDGKEDVVVYSPFRNGFEDIAFVTATENGYELIDDFEEFSKYEYSIVKEGNFIVFRGSNGGTGIYRKYLKLYRYVDGEIAFTGVDLCIEGHTTSFENDSNGQPINRLSELRDTSYKLDTSEDKWVAFNYTYMEKDSDDKLLLKTSDEYYYNNETNTYDVYQLESKFIAKDSSKEALISDGKYELEQLMGVEKLEEFKITEVSYIKRDRYSFELEGKISLKGEIVFDDFEGEESYIFSSDEAYLDYPIRIEDEMKDISNYIDYAYFDKKWIKELPQSAREALKEKKVLEVACTINKISSSGAWGSSRGTSVEFDNIEILSNTTSDNESELENNLSRFTNETLFSVDEEKNIDYSKHHLVIIPQQESANDNKLGNRTVQVTDSGNEFPSRFAIIGEVMSLEFIYYENPLVEGSETKIVKLDEPIKDTIVTVMSKMPYDSSYVKVKGSYMYQSAIEEFSFSLDSMRDYESYEILTFE